MMGNYLNPDTSIFQQVVNSDIYVDKTGLIKYTNSVLFTMQEYICVSRPRRFGKSMAANMLAAYYNCESDSRELFSRFEIAKSNDFGKHLNKYDTILLNMQEFLSQSDNMEEMLALIKKSVLWDFLRDLLKDKGYIHLGYMTGILPIKKYGTHSALNMFDEFSMIDPGPLAPYVGFTEEEVSELCVEYDMSMEEVKSWYNGYSFEHASAIYSPRSVVSCMRFGKIGNYWNQTETFEALQMYIDMNFEGLKDDVISMIAGESVPVNTGSFTNDMTTFRNEDDVLTLLIHLGYLSYDYDHKTVKIPNNEVRLKYERA